MAAMRNSDENYIYSIALHDPINSAWYENRRFSRCSLLPSDGTSPRKAAGVGTMEIDKDKIDDAILALLFLSLDRDGRSRKSFDWDAMNRLHEKGFISNPISKAKSVVLTDERIERSEQLFRANFCKPE